MPCKICRINNNKNEILIPTLIGSNKIMVSYCSKCYQKDILPSIKKAEKRKLKKAKK